MAAAAVSDEDELSCPICFELFVEPNTPKNLSCGHVLCEVCLKQMVAVQRSCPECRQVIMIPKNGIASFSTNFRLRNLAENYQKVEDKPPQQQESPKKAGVPLCPDHEDEKMHCYCVTCNTLACRVCLALKHSGTGHRTGNVKDIYQKQKDVMNTALKNVKSRIDEEERTLSELKTAEIQSTQIYRHVTDVCENVKKQIETCIQDHMNALIMDSQVLIAQAEKAKKMHIDDLTRLKREPSMIQKQIDSANAAYQDAVNATGNLPDYEYITQHVLLINKMKEIEISRQMALTNITKQNVTKFEANSSHTKLGRITFVTPQRVRVIKKIQTLDGFIFADKPDCSSDGLLAIADSDGKKVIIYHQVNDKYEQKLDLKLASENNYKPNGIAISPTGRFMLARLTCIEVYSPDGNHQNDIRIKGLGEVSVHRVQVISDSRILVGDYRRSLIVEISPTGEVIRTIHTSIPPEHMTLIHDTHVALSNREAGKVIVIDIESGHETLSIDINLVAGICYDEHTECLLTARSEPAEESGRVYFNTGVIEQYSYTTGKLVACLQRGVYGPVGMTLTSEGNLIVANVKTVEIYEMQ